LTIPGSYVFLPNRYFMISANAFTILNLFDERFVSS